MSYKYVEVQRNIHSGATPGTRYLAKIFRAGTISPEEVIDRISNHSQVSKASVVGVLEALEELVMEAAQDGEAIKLPYLGMFIPGIEATAKTTLAQVDASTIKRYYMRFYPSVNLAKAIKDTHPAKANLNITGLQASAPYALTEEEYDRLQKEQLRNGGLLEDLEATDVNISSIEIDIKENNAEEN
jgi:predicted histone-like DNA-binding protein